MDKTGYARSIEVEIFQDIQDSPGDEILVLMKERYAACV